MTTRSRYPLSTLSGQAVPLDIIRPTYLQSIDFTQTASSPLIALPADIGILFLRASEDCFVQFGASPASIPVSGAPALVDCLLLETGEVQAISAPASSLSVIGKSLSGTLYIQGLEAWQNLSLEIQQNRI